MPGVKPPATASLLFRRGLAAVFYSCNTSASCQYSASCLPTAASLPLRYGLGPGPVRARLAACPGPCPSTFSDLGVSWFPAAAANSFVPSAIPVRGRLAFAAVPTRGRFAFGCRPAPVMHDPYFVPMGFVPQPPCNAGRGRPALAAGCMFVVCAASRGCDLSRGNPAVAPRSPRARLPRGGPCPPQQ